MNREYLNTLRQLRDVLDQAIAAIESGREVEINTRFPGEYGGAWQEFDFGRHQECRCVIMPHERWFNRLGNGNLSVYAHPTREEALRYANSDREPIRFIEAPFQEEA